MIFDQLEELNSRDGIRDLVMQHCDQYGEETTIKSLLVLTYELMYKYKSNNFCDFNIHQETELAKEVAFFNFLGDIEDLDDN